jgi:hypothetical protein
MAEAVETKTAPASVNVKDTSEFKEAVAAETERRRIELDAEYRRKQKELEDNHRQPAPTPPSAPDWFATWGERHGLPADAGRELVQGAVEFVRGAVLPDAMKSLNDSNKRQEIRSQRTELRSAKPKLARLDDRFHREVMQLLEPMDPRLIGPDSYARALHMVIGQHVEELDAETGKEKVSEAEKEREAAPGPEPLPNAAPSKPKSFTLNANQKQFCEDKGMTEADFVDMMVERARKMETNQGLNKNQVRARLGALLGNLEF